MPTIPKLALSAGLATGSALLALAVALPSWATPFAVDSLSATAGRAGDTVVVSGTSLEDVDQVSFGALSAAYTNSGDTLTVTVPPGAATGTLSIAADKSVHNSPFTILPPADATLTLSRPSSPVVHGDAVTLTGRLAADIDAAGEVVEIWRKLPGTPWAKVASHATDSSGAVHGRIALTSNAQFELRHPASERLTATTSDSHSVTATPKITLASDTTRSTHGKFVLTGMLTPADAGPLTITRTSAETTTSAGTATVETDGTFRMNVTAPAGKHTFRATTAGSDTLAAGRSNALVVESFATALKPGDSGPAVTALQQRLIELKYDHGAVTGTFGYQTKMAVMAFQKVQGLARDGIAGPATRAALEAPAVPTMREKRSGLYLEADLRRQVVLVGRDGTVVKILNTSSGNGKVYRRPGGGYGRANTPTGHFTVQRKIDGLRRAPLGDLYRPIYFNGGIAFHGSPSVPGHPASHGCLRLPNPSMDRLFHQVPRGTSVYVYR